MRQIDIGILFIDSSGTLGLSNDAARHLLNLPLEGKYWDLFSDDFFGFSMKCALQLGLSPRTHFKSYNGFELEIQSSYLPHLSGLLITLRNITEPLQLRKLLHQGDRMRELGSMAASVAHEIRNPLGGIRGLASLLLRDLQETPHLRSLAEQLLEGTHALDRIVSQVLAYARPLSLQLKTVDIAALLRNILTLFRHEVPHSIRLEAHLPQVQATVDPDALRSTVLNLLLNGLQAMPQGGTLTLSLLPSLSTYQIAITDTGVGIDPADLPRLFTPFFTTKKTGTGLGLVEVHKIVTAHFGTIDVRSNPGSGTTFTLQLPYAPHQTPRCG